MKNILFSIHVLLSPSTPKSFNYITINTNQEIGKIEIFSTLDLKVLETELKVKIDVSGLAPGLYFVRVGDNVCKFAIK